MKAIFEQKKYFFVDAKKGMKKYFRKRTWTLSVVSNNVQVNNILLY